jgi:hypothetical protein
MALFVANSSAVFPCTFGSYVAFALTLPLNSYYSSQLGDGHQQWLRDRLKQHSAEVISDYYAWEAQPLPPDKGMQQLVYFYL